MDYETLLINISKIAKKTTIYYATQNLGEDFIYEKWDEFLFLSGENLSTYKEKIENDIIDICINLFIYRLSQKNKIGHVSRKTKNELYFRARKLL